MKIKDIFGIESVEDMKGYIYLLLQTWHAQIKQHCDNECGDAYECEECAIRLIYDQLEDHMYGNKISRGLAAIKDTQPDAHKLILDGVKEWANLLFLDAYSSLRKEMNEAIQKGEVGK